MFHVFLGVKNMCFANEQGFYMQDKLCYLSNYNQMPIDLPVSATTWQLAKTACHGDTAEKYQYWI